MSSGKMAGIPRSLREGKGATANVLSRIEGSSPREITSGGSVLAAWERAGPQARTPYVRRDPVYPRERRERSEEANSTFRSRDPSRHVISITFNLTPEGELRLR